MNLHKSDPQIPPSAPRPHPFLSRPVNKQRAPRPQKNSLVPSPDIHCRAGWQYKVWLTTRPIVASPSKWWILGCERVVLLLWSIARYICWQLHSTRNQTFLQQIAVYSRHTAFVFHFIIISRTPELTCKYRLNPHLDIPQLPFGPCVASPNVD